jgi:hypothetical protein
MVSEKEEIELCLPWQRRMAICDPIILDSTTARGLICDMREIDDLHHRLGHFIESIVVMLVRRLDARGER